MPDGQRGDEKKTRRIAQSADSTVSSFVDSSAQHRQMRPSLIAMTRRIMQFHDVVMIGIVLLRKLCQRSTTMGKCYC